MFNHHIRFSIGSALILAALLAACSSGGQLIPQSSQTAARSNTAPSRAHTARPMDQSAGSTYCDDGSEAIYGPNHDLCADGSLPSFPPVTATPAPCWDNCYYAPCGFYCNGSGYPPPPSPPPPPPTPPPGQTNYSNCIAKAAANEKGKSTRGLKGAPTGSECVAAVQQTLDDAGLSEIGNGTLAVSSFASSLPYSGYDSVPQGSAGPGDIVVLSDAQGGTHVGICETAGCTTMISNSSSAGTFSWEDSPQNQDAEAAKADDNLGPGPISYFHHPGSGSCPL